LGLENDTALTTPKADHRMMLGLLGEFGDIGPTREAGGGAEPSTAPITDRMAIRTMRA
jgi:hypothetical protein